jgi:hypothetical protein
MNSPSPFGDQHDLQGNMAEHEVNSSFIDALSQSMGFSEADDEYRNSLHTFPKACLVLAPHQFNTNSGQLARGLPKGQIQSHLIQIGLLYSILKECRALAEASRANRVMMSEIQGRLEETFSVSQEQRVSLWFSI